MTQPIYLIPPRIICDWPIELLLSEQDFPFPLQYDPLDVVALEERIGYESRDAD